MPKQKCPGTAKIARTIPTDKYDSALENKYIIFSNAAKPRDTQTAYTIPSIFSSKYGFLRNTNHSTKNFAISSGIAAPKNAVLILPKMLVASAGYIPIKPNGIDMHKDNGIDNTP